ncbi:MAG TPA: LapA family protein [Nitrospirae bacterium]|nr:LapA family protein [Nitrospirota bacterium]
MDRKGAIGVRGVIVIILVLIIVAFLLQNSQVVEIQFLGWKWSMSKVILIVFSMFVGALIGLILGRELFRKREKKDIFKK